MPRQPRNPGTGKPPHNGPAQGPGKGDGWGGPPKGGVYRPPTPFTADSPTRSSGAADPVKRLSREEKAARDEARAEDAEALLHHSITHGTFENNRITAAIALRDRIKGGVVTRNINVATEDLSALDDDALIARQAELDRKLNSTP